MTSYTQIICGGKGCHNLSKPGYNRCDPCFETGDKCRVLGCNTTSHLNYPGRSNNVFCKKHSYVGMTDVKKPKCVVCADNITNAQYGWPGQPKIYCRNHADFSMIPRKNETQCTGRGCYKQTKDEWHTRCEDCLEIGTKCKIRGCNKSGNFNLPERENGIYCLDHVRPGMVNVRSKNCLHCTKRALFGEPGGVKLYCKDHSSPLMVDLQKPRCQIEGCAGNPRFNVPGQTRPILCGNHKMEGMVCVIKRGCLGDNRNCTKSPEYNLPGQEKPKYCNIHRLETMIYIPKTKCVECGITARFNYPTEKKGLYCASHRKDSMIERRKQTCKFPGCFTSPSHGYPGSRSRIFCSSHVEMNMINYKAGKCVVADCPTVPSFCKVGETKSTHCGSHREDDMVRSNKQYCTYPNCIREKRFGFPGGRPEYCSIHRNTSMILLRCQNCTECDQRALYGIYGESVSRCSTHRIEGMIIDPKNRCKSRSCTQVAIYGVTKPLHCEDHKESNEVNLKERPCRLCGLDNLLGQDELCKICNPDNFRKIRLAKQNVVEDFLRLHRYVFQSDRTVDRGECGLERPDFLFLAGTHAVIVEVDECASHDRFA